MLQTVGSDFYKSVYTNIVWFLNRNIGNITTYQHATNNGTKHLSSMKKVRLMRYNDKN